MAGLEKSEKQLRPKAPQFLALGWFLFALFVFGLSTFHFQLEAASAASAPAIITYQGKLLNSSNSAVTTTVSAKFVLFSSLTGGTALYTASGTLPTTSTISITPTNGLFTVNLGDTGTNSLNPNIFQNNQTIYLEVTVAGETLSPRKLITASPFAYNAKYLDGIAATSTASTSVYIPISDAGGNFNFNGVTSTRLHVSGTSFTSGALLDFITGRAITGSRYQLGRNTNNNLQFNVPAFNGFVFSTNDSPFLSISSTQIFFSSDMTNAQSYGGLVDVYISNETNTSGPLAIYDKTGLMVNKFIGGNSGETIGTSVIGIETQVGQVSGTGVTYNGSFIGGNFLVDAPTGGNKVGSIIGVQARATNFGSVVDSATGVSSLVELDVANDFRGAVTTSIALSGAITVSGGNHINAYGLYISPISASSGTIANAYGARIEAPATGTIKWTLGAGTGNSYVRGNLVVGSSSTPAFTIDTQGTFRVTGTSTLATTTISGITLMGTTTLPSTNYKLFIDAGTSTSPGLGVNGYVQASGFITGTTTLDLAELYPIEPNCADTNACPEPGDAVCLMPGSAAMVAKCSTAYSNDVLGIVSTNPGFTLGGLGSSTTRKVALAGRVPMKVSAASGPIKAGDRLTTAVESGAVQKATAAGPVVGIAMEDWFPDSAKGRALLGFVHIGWWGETSSDGLIFGLATSTSESGLLARAAEWLKALGVSIEQGLVKITHLVSDLISAKKVETVELQADKICLRDTCVTETELRELLNRNQLNSALTPTLAPAPTPTASVGADPDPAAPPSAASITIIDIASTTESAAPTASPTVLTIPESSAATDIINAEILAAPAAPAEIGADMTAPTPAPVTPVDVSPSPSAVPN